MQFSETTFQVKTAVATFCVTFVKFGLLFISTAGHTGQFNNLSKNSFSITPFQSASDYNCLIDQSFG